MIFYNIETLFSRVISFFYIKFEWRWIFFFCDKTDDKTTELNKTDLSASNIFKTTL